MKTRNYFFLAALLTMGLAACTEMDEMPESPQSRVPVQLTTQLTAVDADVTRAATSLNNTALTSGNVNVWLSGAYGTAYTYTAGSGGALTSSSPAYYPSSGTVDIVAVYPSGKISNASTSTDFTVAADQSTDANYKASDLMRGILTDKSKTSGPQTIALSHKMSKIIVNVTAGDGVSSISSVTLNNIKRKIAYTASTDALGNAVSVSGTNVSMGTNNCAAVIPPQTISANTNFLTIVTNAGTAVYQFASAKALSSGYYYQLNITVNRTATLATNTIAAWDGSGTANIGATTTAGELTIGSISAYTYDGNAKTPTPTVQYNSTTLTKDTHYSLVYTNNTNAGTATVTAVGLGAYAGKVGVKEFTINKATRSAGLGLPTFSPTSVSLFLNGVNTADVTASFIADGQTLNAEFTSSNTSVATVTAKSASDGHVTYTVTGVSANTTTLNFHIPEGDNFLEYSGTSVVTVNVASVNNNGHAYVDLGLSVLWATMNVGASSATDYGNFYCWGGTTDVTNTSINLGWNSTCPYWSSGSDSNAKFTKYVPTAKTSYWAGSGSPDNKTVLEMSDDAARQIWGGDWRMPTEAEYSELINNCTWTWNSNYNSSGIAGYVVSGNGNSIFLPAAGFRYGTYLNGQGSIGYYWSSSLNTDLPYSGRGLYFDGSNKYMYNSGRYGGRSVRAVLSK